MTPVCRWGMMRPVHGAMRCSESDARPRAPAPGGDKMAEGVLEFTDQNFDADVIGSDTPVLVDFWAEWCAPCKMIAPTVEALAREYEGQVRIGKLNIDENPSVPSKFGIRGIPTLMLFKGGEVAEQIVGVKPKADLKAAIDRAL